MGATTDTTTIRLDSKDYEILEELETDARQPIFRMAKKLGLPPTTIHNRIKKLRTAGIIQNYTITINREAIGQQIRALIFVSLDNNLLEAASKKGGLAKRLSTHPNVNEVFETTGTSDVIVKFYGKSIQELNEFVIQHIREIRGVTKTETVLILSEQKRGKAI